MELGPPNSFPVFGLVLKKMEMEINEIPAKFNFLTKGCTPWNWKYLHVGCYFNSVEECIFFRCRRVHFISRYVSLLISSLPHRLSCSLSLSTLSIFLAISLCLAISLPCLSLSPSLALPSLYLTILKKSNVFSFSQGIVIKDCDR